MRGMSGTIADVIRQNGSKLVDIGVGFASLAISKSAGMSAVATVGYATGLATPVGLGTTLALMGVSAVGMILKGCVEVTAEMSKDAIEYAAYQNDFENAFTHLFEIMYFQECFKEWKKAVIRISDLNRIEENRSMFERQGKDAFTKERKRELQQKGIYDK